MTPETLEALKASIAKWERNAEVASADAYLIDSADCPLCDLFFHVFCEGCPVSESSGQECCRGTPYVAANRAWSAWDADASMAQEAHEAARKEVAFLKSLLPEESP